MPKLTVAVAGAKGRMGSLAVDAINRADDMVFAGGFARGGDLRALLSAKPDVLVDFTTHPGTVEVATQCVMHGVSPVVGATGWTEAEKAALAAVAEQHRVAALLVPNFAVGAVLMMRFAEQAAKYFPSVEIVELHHDQKRDKPSGTAKLTAQRVAAATGEAAPPIHSVRMRGLLAHQEVLLGNTGELLTIRHDSLSRDSFVAGILLAVRSAPGLRPGLTVGLDSLLEGLPK